MSNQINTYKLHCSASGTVKNNLVNFAKKNGHNGYSGLISEACYLYHYEPGLFKKMNVSPSNDSNRIRNNIQYDTSKYKQYVYDKFKLLSDKNFTPLNHEFSLFIYKLDYYIQNNSSLPYPRKVSEKFPKSYLEYIVPILRNDNCLIEFYNLVELILNKGAGFEIKASDLCHLLLLNPEQYENYNYTSSIRNKIYKLNTILESKIHVRGNAPNIKIWIERFPYLQEP